MLATGGYMLMPFGSAFSINNLGITLKQLPLLYGITGVFSIITGPLLGKASDAFGKFKLFVAGTAVAIAMVLLYTNLGITPLWELVVINVILFIGITARMISAIALMSAVPKPQDRGAFMSINSSVQSIAGGIGAYCAGLLIVQTPSGHIDNYNRLGFAVTASMLIVMFLLFRIDRFLKQDRTV